MTRTPDDEYLLDLGYCLLELSRGMELNALAANYLAEIKSYLDSQEFAVVKIPPARWECRPPKQGELIWNGVDKRVVLCPYDSKENHWILVPIRWGEHA